jgi:hydrogenase maturation factor
VLRETSSESSDLYYHCVTCSDEALPATVLSVDRDAGLALVQLESKQAEVDIALVEEVVPGDLLLVHGGVGLTNLGTKHQDG